MNCQFVLLAVVLVASVRGSPPQHGKDRAYGYQVSNAGGSYGAGEQHAQHSTTDVFNAESQYQQNQYGGQSNSNGGLANGGFGHGIHHGHGAPSQGGFGQGGFSQGGFSQGGFGQGGFGQGGFGQGGFGQGGLGQGGSQHQGGLGQGGLGQGGSQHQGGLGQGGLNHGGLQYQQHFRNAGEMDGGGSVNIDTDFPKKNDEAIVFGNQPVSGDWASIQQQTGMFEGGISGIIRRETPLLTSTTWGAGDTDRNYRKISSSAILPLSYTTEHEPNFVPGPHTSLKGSTAEQGSRN